MYETNEKENNTTEEIREFPEQDTFNKDDMSVLVVDEKEGK